MAKDGKKVGSERSGMGLGTCSSGVKGNGTTTDCRLRVT